ncbi:MAG: prolyl oligopeptidase family serine peptidase [Clostridia bacterium]|nr:prolyl oligopeptidase family serine peptidase [Clostridia bacterium]
MKRALIVILAAVMAALSVYIAVPSLAEQNDSEPVSAGVEITGIPGEEESTTEPQTTPPTQPFKDPVSYRAGGDAVRAQFEYGKDQGSGTRFDYYVYSPVNKGFETDRQFPLVVWIHGLGEGQTTSGPLYENDFPYWSCKELQSRFAAGGAYIMIPRAPENQAQIWSDSLTEPLMECIKNFAAQNNVDMRRIFIGGFSNGAKMVFKCVRMYPNFFAGALPIAPYYTATSDEAKAMKNTPVWFFGCTMDPLVNYPTAVSGVFSEAVSDSPVKELSRITKFSRASNIWGGSPGSNHRIWHAVSADMFVGFEGELMPTAVTKNGVGAEVTLVAPDGVISWMNQCGNAAAPENNGNKNTHSFLDSILNFFKRFAAFFARLFSF